MAHQEGLSAEAKTAARAVREPPPPRPKRFYQRVSVDGPPFRVLLDDKPVSTPLRRPLVAPTRAMADAVAAEWDAQVTEVDPSSMHVMRLLATWIDKVADGRAALTDELLAHADADLICYRADNPADLKARQDRTWQPVLNGLRDRYGLSINVGEGVLPFTQLPATKSRLREVVDGLDAGRFTAAQAVAGITGSLALAITMADGATTAAGVFEAALLDELYQRDKWGEDNLARARRDAIAADLAGIEVFLKAL